MNVQQHLAERRAELRRERERLACRIARGVWVVEQRLRDVRHLDARLEEVERMQAILDGAALAPASAEPPTETEHATVPEPIRHRRKRGRLAPLVLAAVQNHPGFAYPEIAANIALETGIRTLPAAIKAKLEALADEGTVERRFGKWYPIKLELPLKAREGDEQDEVEAETAPQGLSEASPGTATDGACETVAEGAARAPELPTAPAPPAPEVTLDFIRRAGSPGLSVWQLKNHLDNLDGLVARGLIERIGGEHMDAGNYRIAAKLINEAAE